MRAGSQLCWLRRNALPTQKMKTGTIKLNDFNHWKHLNASQHFSLYDYLFHKISNQSGTGTDVLFAFLELFFPAFIEHEGYVFLRENFNLNYFQSPKTQNAPVEYWMNLLMLGDYFAGDNEGVKKAQYLAKAMVKMWQMKLKEEFPQRKFIVSYLEDKEMRDYGLTFLTRF